MRPSKLLPFLFLLGSVSPVLSQIRFTGSVVDAASRAPLAYVHVGIKQQNTGTTSLADGSFAIRIAQANAGDTLTFSLVGYAPAEVPIRLLRAAEPVTIRLRQKTVQLSEVKITAEKRVEKKYGIKRRNRLLHFTDGMFQNGTHEGFEIAQLIRLGDAPARITSINLHLNAPRTDSASFRINFYGYDGEGPTGRIVEKSIIQKQPIREGWLSFDLTAHHVALQGSFVAAIEFLPETRKNLRPIYYEVKLGGSSRSFYRRSSLGTWNRPPHHYCLYVTALVDKGAPEETEDTETPPTFTLPSALVSDSFNLFVRLPKAYHKDPQQRYPVVYHLDANAYFDAISHATTRLAKKKKLGREPIVVGIGYGNAFMMDSLRVRDYTFPPAPASDGLPRSGGGDNFYRFIQRELVPYIDRVYRTDTTRRTLMGHSFGGYFTLYALLRGRNERALFTHYVAASPVLDYCDAYLTRQFERLSLPGEGNAPPRLYLTAGEREVAEDPYHHLDRFIALLKKEGAIRLRTKIYQNLEHLGTAIPSLEEGVEFSGE